MSWHKPARIAVAVFGVASAAGVYFAIGSRTPTASLQPIQRIDPKAILESTKAVLQQVHKSEEDFEVRAARSLSYEDGSAKMFDVRVSVKKRDGRDFLVTAREATSGKDRKELRLVRDVVLQASDGFELKTDDATYTEADGVVRAPGRVAFSKGGLSGSGVGMTYDKNNDVLTLLAEPDVTMAPAEASAGTSFKSGSAVLDRVMDLLVLSGGAHAQRGEQTFEAVSITARLASDEQYVRAVEMRGNARVAGGGGTLDAMSADAIDLAYVEGGDILDRVTLTGKASAALVPKGTQTGRRQLVGGSLDLQLATDGSLTHAGGRDGIRFDLPVTEKSRGQSIRAKTFDANGTAGAGLTSASFVDDVEFREEGEKGTAPRAARSRTLNVSLDQDELTDATFKGSVTFEDRGLAACAADVRYKPKAGSIQLSGSDAGGSPRASDDQVAIAAEAIDVTLQGTQMSARGGVKTVLRPPREARGGCVPRLAAGRGDGAAAGGTESKLPGLLKQNAPVNVNADRVSYAGSGGAATYTGGAMLVQGDTSIRAEELRLDQENGDFIASGGARAMLILDGKQSLGRGDVIRYEDKKHLVTYDTNERPPAPARGRVTAAAPLPAPVPATPANVARGARSGGGSRRGQTPATAPIPVASGPMQAYVQGTAGELRAWRIEMFLSPDSGKADRLEAYDEVNLRVAMRRANGDRLTYFSADERYVMTGTAAAPVCVVDAQRASTGKTLVFYRSADKLLVDGNEEIPTQTKSGQPCAIAPAR